MFDLLSVPARIVVGSSPPWMTVLAVIAIIVAIIWWILARVRAADDARRRRMAANAGHDVGAFQGEGFEGHDARRDAGAHAVESARDHAWRELFAPQTGSDRLTEIAVAHPEFATQIAQHPNCSPELRAWAATQRP